MQNCFLGCSWIHAQRKHPHDWSGLGERKKKSLKEKVHPKVKIQSLSPHPEFLMVNITVPFIRLVVWSMNVSRKWWRKMTSIVSQNPP